MVRRVAFGALALSVAACSLFTDFGGFTDPPAATDDASDKPTSDAEAGEDVSSPEADVPNADAGAHADASAPDGCIPNANTVCESFDLSTSVPMNWVPVVSRGEVPIIPRADAPSAPNVLRASINASPNDPAFAQLLRTFPVTPTEVATLEHDLFIDEIGTAYANLSSLDLRLEDGTLYSLQLSHQFGEAFIEEYSKVGDAQAHSYITQRTSLITLGKWHRIVISVRKTIPRSYSLTIDGALFLTQPIKDEAPPEALTAGKIRVALGISYQGQGPAIKTFIDNVKLTWK